MKVLLIRSDMKLAGPARLMLASAEALRSLGVEVAFASGGGALVEEAEARGFAHHLISALELSNRSVTGSLKVAMALAGLVRRHGFDVVHSFNAHAGICAAPTRLLFGTRIVNTVLGVGKEHWNKYIPGTIIAVSDSVRQRLLAARVRDAKIRIVYNANLDARFVLDDAGITALMMARRQIAPVTLVSVAMFTGQKGHERILGFLRDFHANRPDLDFRMVFVGDGVSRQACETMAAEYGLTGLVTFAGASDQVPDFLDRAHVFIHFPSSETFGMVLAEANARALPVLAAKVGGIPEVIADGETGFVVANDDTEGVMARLDQLLGDDALRETLGRAGAERARTLFHQDRLGEGLLAAYDSPRTPTRG